MYLFETILFYNGVPSYYNVYKQEDKYYMEANTPEYYKSTYFPNFSPFETNGQWKADGTEDANLVAQVVKDIERYSVSRIAAIAE